MSALWPARPRMRTKRRQLGLIGRASTLLATSVAAVVPLQRRNPVVVLAASVVEVGSLVALIVTGNLAAMFALVGTSLMLIGVMLTNARQLIALTEKGNAILATSVWGWPTGVIGPLPPHLRLPEPAGLGVRFEVAGTAWWIDRSAYRMLRRARSFQALHAEEAEE